MIDDGVEGYSGRRFDPVSGLPVCNNLYPPGTVVGNYQTASAPIRTMFRAGELIAAHWVNRYRAAALAAALLLFAPVPAQMHVTCHNLDTLPVAGWCLRRIPAQSVAHS